MSQDGSIKAIDKRYSDLASSTCCLSCGGAINFGKPQPGEVCVDLGSGRGQDVLKMAEEVGQEGFVYGIDASEGMLSRAKRNAEKLGIENVQFVSSELESLELPDEVADLAISNCTINHASDKQSVFNELYRILKPGGRFAISDIYSLQAVPQEYRNDPEAVAECWAGAILREDYLDLVASAGFTKVQILEESEPYAKGKIEVASFTIVATKPNEPDCCCCGSSK